VTRFSGGPVESPGFLLWHATLRWQRAVTAALAPLGLTHVQFVLLACAWWASRSDDSPNQASVASQAGTDPKMTSEVLVRLQAKGLLDRVPDPHDARAKLLSVTPAGSRLAARAIDVVEAVDTQFFGDQPDRSEVALLQRLAGVA
jgi:DNA-binding MarR family transcriptional regulator